MTTAPRLFSTSAPAAVILIRIMVGGIFLSEGIQKFLFPADSGAGRFVKIGIPYPEFSAGLSGTFEIVCGTLLLVGFLTRLAAIPLLINITVAILSTKIPVLLHSGFWRFSLPKVNYYGLWGFLHEARTDLSMVLGLIFLLIVGAGAWSLDAGMWERDSGTP
jgi:putative oxidoreductase